MFYSPCVKSGGGGGGKGWMLSKSPELTPHFVFDLRDQWGRRYFTANMTLLGKQNLNSALYLWGLRWLLNKCYRFQSANKYPNVTKSYHHLLTAAFLYRVTKNYV